MMRKQVEEEEQGWRDASNDLSLVVCCCSSSRIDGRAIERKQERRE